jgi:hypothetical protein
LIIKFLINYLFIKTLLALKKFHIKERKKERKKKLRGCDSATSASTWTKSRAWCVGSDELELFGRRVAIEHDHNESSSHRNGCGNKEASRNP